MIKIFVDADACPVKDEVYVVATRCGLPVVLVANSRMSVPSGFGVELVVVDRDADAADDWIAAHVHRSDVVITSDIPLAARCLSAGAHVLGTDGRPFTEDSIGDALASRELNSDLRAMGIQHNGPRALSERHRSRFLSRLDQMVHVARREVSSAHPAKAAK